MNAVSLGWVALLGGALMAFGCSSGSGATGGSGGSAGAGGGGAGGAGGGIPVTEYEENFESLDQASATALSDDPHPEWGGGWTVFGNLFQPDGTYIDGYGPDPAPNNTGAFSGIALEQGGPEQGDQVLVVISDYNNTDEQDAGNLVEGNTFRNREIALDDVGKTLSFSFDAKRGNINDPDDQLCPCDSTAFAFIRTVDPDTFELTNDVMEDTTALPITWGRYELSLEIDSGVVGQVLQFGFSGTATNFEPSGVFYDNILVVTTE
ncbi:MAG: hypothetical protein HKN10_13480 [Myxococcales bacterium]|nr:hypothetical protein [Myxococcales bacterium]